MSFLLCFLLLLPAVELDASRESNVLHVATKESPPFAFKQGDGWVGPSIELVKQIAHDRGEIIVFHEVPREQMLRSVAEGKVDVAIAAITPTAEREDHLDFGMPYYATGYGLAVPVKSVGFFQRVFTWDTAKLFGWVLGFLLTASLLFWSVERKHNPDISDSFYPGIFQSMYFMGYTIPTVGFGDITRTVAGRVITILTIMASLYAVVVFQSKMSATFMVEHQETNVTHLSELAGKPVSTLKGSASESWLLDAAKYNVLTFDSLDEAAEAVRKGEAVGLVYDYPAMARKKLDGLKLLDKTFGQIFYAMAFKDDSPLIEDFDRQVLILTGSYWWEAQLERYMNH